MKFQLEGKTALVTGSTAGIGLAIATALAKEGAAVIVNGRTQERVDKAVRVSGAVHGIAADLGTEAGARAVIARFPAVDILVNNLGIFEPKPFEQIPDDDWRRFFEVNVLSGVRLSRHYISAMKRNNGWHGRDCKCCTARSDRIGGSHRIRKESCHGEGCRP